ncbi:hypothetical protein MESS2_1250045 [Mesorhizobium metallidurans STM 2683]|uniref:Uncharacterized protein n=1 Tax=Mesorhizobium metallidurans STM 2683 TaxID=1297569 RepID=M5EJA0_9HYPH|nr:hypothetical protein MESS2_1250045 [Mesorhizobium metallidurans STM 2683]
MKFWFRINSLRLKGVGHCAGLSL